MKNPVKASRKIAGDRPVRDRKAAAKPRRRREARPAEIVAAARRVFLDKGFSAARIDDVAKAAGASKGTIYLYYESKEALFEAMALETLEPVLAGLERLGSLEGLAPDKAIEGMLMLAYDEVVLTDRRDLIRIIIAEGTRFPAIAGFYHERLISRARALTSSVIRRGIEEGVFRADAPWRHPEVLVAPVIVSAIWKMLFDPYERLDIDDVKKEHLQMIRRTLLAENPPES